MRRWLLDFCFFTIASFLACDGFSQNPSFTVTLNGGGTTTGTYPLAPPNGAEQVNVGGAASRGAPLDSEYFDFCPTEGSGYSCNFLSHNGVQTIRRDADQAATSNLQSYKNSLQAQIDKINQQMSQLNAQIKEQSSPVTGQLPTEIVKEMSYNRGKMAANGATITKLKNDYQAKLESSDQQGAQKIDEILRLSQSRTIPPAQAPLDEGLLSSYLSAARGAGVSLSTLDASADPTSAAITYLDKSGDKFSELGYRAQALRAKQWASELNDYRANNANAGTYRQLAATPGAAAQYRLLNFTPSTFQGYETIKVANELAMTPAVLANPYLRFHAAIAVENLKASLAMENIEFFAANLQIAYSIVDFGRGFATGILHGSVDLSIVMNQLIWHPIDSIAAVSCALIFYQNTFNALVEKTVAIYQDSAGWDAAQWGEFYGEVTVQIGALLVGGGEVADAPTMNDPRWPTSDGWQKWQTTTKVSDGRRITIHYNRNVKTGQALTLMLILLFRRGSFR